MKSTAFVRRHLHDPDGARRGAAGSPWREGQRLEVQLRKASAAVVRWWRPAVGAQNAADARRDEVRRGLLIPDPRLW
jgi:hypothetical protein